MTPDGHLQDGLREEYSLGLKAISGEFRLGIGLVEAGLTAMRARSALVDKVVRALAVETMPEGFAVVAVGGYGRRELSLHSDVDLMFLVDAAADGEAAGDAAAAVARMLWDVGMRVAPVTRRAEECGEWDPANVEATMALLDARLVCGDDGVFRRLMVEGMPELLAREGKAIRTRLTEVTAARYARYGGTVFHLEPNIKECPGGLRDLHVLRWLARLDGRVEDGAPRKAHGFLCGVRWFLHERYRRDYNVLDWPGQEAAAELGLGVGERGGPERWMRNYFRHARGVKRSLERRVELRTRVTVQGGVRGIAGGVEIRDGRIELAGVTCGRDAEAVPGMFALAAQTGLRLSREAEDRVERALPELSAQVEDGPMLWHALSAVLTGRYAGAALRMMHELGVLELLIPEFHGIDALVVRDAYHRYTVDEHTFVVIDTLHELAAGLGRTRTDEGVDWAGRFSAILRDISNPELLYLAALLHDMGKAWSAEAAGAEGVRLTATVLARLEMDSFEGAMVAGLVRDQAEMVTAMRRDAFDGETVQVLGEMAATPQRLRMLTVFTYADIAAVHPGAMTAWKAEQLWLLFSETLKYLDRGVDDERIEAWTNNEAIYRVLAVLPGHSEAVHGFLEGFPARYLLTRTAEQVRAHFLMALRVSGSEVELDFRYASEMCEITLVTRDRELLFARMAGVLARLGMNIVSADAFSNRQGIVVDSFRFTDAYRTLEMNAPERERFVEQVREAFAGDVLPVPMPRRRRASPVSVTMQIDFEQQSLGRSTLLQIVANDEPGLLYRVSKMIAEAGCNVEVAIVDTEGGTAIDVFYLTKEHRKLNESEEAELSSALSAELSG